VTLFCEKAEGSLIGLQTKIASTDRLPEKANELCPPGFEIRVVLLLDGLV